MADEIDEDNILRFTPKEVGENFVVECDNVLEAAKGQLAEVVIVGTTPDGENYVASSHGMAKTIFLMEYAKYLLLSGD